MGEPASGVASSNGGEGSPGGSPERIIGASLSPAKAVFDFGERFLDRIEVGRVRRQMAEGGAARFDGRAGT